jgi:hypothetical protein
MVIFQSYFYPATEPQIIKSESSLNNHLSFSLSMLEVLLMLCMHVVLFYLSLHTFYELFRFESFKLLFQTVINEWRIFHQYLWMCFKHFNVRGNFATGFGNIIFCSMLLWTNNNKHSSAHLIYFTLGFCETFKIT